MDTRPPQPDPGELADLAAPPVVEGGRIAGVVTDFEGTPLTGVRVEAAQSGGADLDLLPVISDGDGRFVIEGLADGRYDLRFSLGQVRTRTLAVPTGADQLRVRLARPQGILLVVKTEPGKPEPGAVHVVLLRETEKGPLREHFGRSLRTRQLLWNIRPGRYAIWVWGGPYLPVEVRDVEVREGAPAPEVEVLLAAEGGVVEGRVEPGRGRGDVLLAWRRVDAPGPWVPTETTQVLPADGRFVLRGLPHGLYRIFAGRADGAIAEAEVTVSDAPAPPVDLRVPA